MKNEDHENEDRSLKTPENDKEDAEVFFFTSFLRSKIHVKFFEKKGNSTFKEFW